MNYFRGFTTVETIKLEWRRLCFLHHPDVGGDTATMQQVNIQYHEALAQGHGQTAKGSDGQEHTYYYSQDIEQAVMDKIEELLALRLPGVEILLVGTWIWVDGDTRPVKEQLKEVKLKWHSKRKKWFWHTPSYRRSYNSSGSFDDICQAYGVKGFKSSPQSALS